MSDTDPRPPDPETPPETIGSQVSAGGVLLRRTAGRTDVCLIAKHSGRIWALPKGRLNEGETAEQAAVREVLEETGQRGRIVDKLGDITYDFHWKTNNTHYHKVVSFYLMMLVEEDAQSRDGEADAVEWVEIKEAGDRITHDNERDMILKAARLARNLSEDRFRPD